MNISIIKLGDYNTMKEDETTNHIITTQITGIVEDYQQQLEEYLTEQHTTKTVKDGNNISYYLEPLVPVDVARYLFRRSSELRKVVKAYSKDVLLNEFTLAKSDIETDEENEKYERDLEILNSVWNNQNNKKQLYFAGIEAFVYGYGVMETIGSGADTEFKQIPAHTIRLRCEIWESDVTRKQYKYYYVEQQLQDRIVKLRLSHLDYRLLDKYAGGDDSEGYCIWFGGSNESDFFDIPEWESCSEDIFTCLAIKKMNMKKIERGNIPAGVLMFQGPRALPDPKHPDEPRIDHKLEQDLGGTHSGTVFTYLESNSSSRDITMSYQALTDNNYDYLKQNREDCERSILSAYLIPPQRLMRLDQKESMNSDKTERTFEIYTTEEVPSAQMLFKGAIDAYNQAFLGMTHNVLMNSPEFVDKTLLRIESIVTLFDKGLLPLGVALDLLADVYPQIDLLADLPEDLSTQRFYDGKILGIDGIEQPDNEELDNAINKINQIIGSPYEETPTEEEE